MQRRENRLSVSSLRDPGASTRGHSGSTTHSSSTVSVSPSAYLAGIPTQSSTGSAGKSACPAQLASTDPLVPTGFSSARPSTCVSGSASVRLWSGLVEFFFPGWFVPSASADAKSWPMWLKVTALSIIFVVQVSMNFNAAVYGFAGAGMEEEFGVGEEVIKLGQALFLIMYAFGCELWAPFSEELGRKPIMQASLWLVNLFALMAALADNVGVVIAARVLGGLSSAGGSVTLGIVADMYSPYLHQYALGAIVLSSCGGSVVGPLVGGPIKAFVDWRWIFWAQFIFGVATALAHLFWCPETDEHCLECARFKKDQRARRAPAGLISPEHKRPRMSFRQVLRIMVRPFAMLVREPVVLCLSLLSGFSDALVFTCFESYGLVFGQWDFNDWQIGLAFGAIMLGNIIAFGLHCIDFGMQRSDIRARQSIGDGPPKPERRLKALLFAAPLLPIGIFIFAGTSVPEAAHWIVPLFASMLVGIANFAIYMTTIDYMVAVYGKEYAASATGGNGFCRDLLAGISAWYAKRLYQDLGPAMPIQKGSFLLGGLAVVLVAPIYGVYFRGEWLRERSEKAKGLEDADFGSGGNIASVHGPVVQVSQLTMTVDPKPVVTEVGDQPPSLHLTQTLLKT